MSVVRRPPIFVIETGANPGPASGGLRPAWISGNPASLPDGAGVNMLFDLGPDWDQYPFVQVTYRPVGATSFSGCTASSRDDGVANVNADRYLRMDSNGGVVDIMFATVVTANAAGCVRLRPMGRYLVLAVTNTAGSGAMGASTKVTVTGYPA